MRHLCVVAGFMIVALGPTWAQAQEASGSVEIEQEVDQELQDQEGSEDEISAETNAQTETGSRPGDESEESENAEQVSDDGETEEQGDEPPAFDPETFGRETPPSERTDDQLEEGGWEVSEEIFRPGDLWGGVLALTGGLAVHGAGHFYVGDRDGGLRLLASELAALAAFGIGTLVTQYGSNSDGAYYAGAALQVAGGGLFAWGWLGDVIGTFKSTTVRLPEPTDRATGFTGQLLYSSVFASPTAIGSIAELGVSWHGDRFEVDGRGEYAPAARFYHGSARLGYRIPIGKEDRTALTIEATVGEEAALEYGWGRDRIAIGLSSTVDMGELLPHVRGLLWKVRVLGWTDFYFYDSQDYRRFRAENIEWHLPIETGFGMNVNQGIYIELGYRHRTDLLIGSLFDSGGAFYQRFSILPIEAFGIEFEMEEAEYFRLHVGIRWQLSTDEE